MCINKLGSVAIHPRALLIDGLRKELNLRLAQILVISQENIVRTLSVQTSRLETLRYAFLFVCEHIGINGRSIWRTESENVFASAIRTQKDGQLRRTKVTQIQPNNHLFIIY